MSLSSISVTSPGYVLIILVLVWVSKVGTLRHFQLALCLTGVLLLGSWLNKNSFILMIAAIIPHYLVLRNYWLRERRPGQIWLWLVVVWQLLILVSTKLGPISMDFGIVGVSGLSYITFRQLHLMFELSSRSMGNSLSFAEYFSYLLNPWTLLAGPIQTYTEYTQGLREKAELSWPSTILALNRIATGAIKVLILAPIFQGQGSIDSIYPGSVVDKVVVFYSYYIFLYLDFSGYMDIVNGAAFLCGVNRLTENFNRPYLATNFQDFWGRWHISLGEWFRIHVFTPLLTFLMRSSTGRRWLSHDLAIAAALFVVFLLIGIWHGIAWNYIIFGVVHATMVSMTYLSRKMILRRLGKVRLLAYEKSRWLLPIRIVVCQHGICATFVLLDNSFEVIWGKL